jgi:hypothetical protein
VTAAPALPDHDPQAAALAGLTKAFQARLHLPDLGALYATLGAVAGNWMRGDPVWLLLVGPPSSGKTELVGALGKLPHVHWAALFTEAALLSGTASKERAKDAKGGLLREIGSFGILLAKDFTSTLAQNRDTRAQALAALREVYDGHWSRPVGTEGGKVLHWSGKVGLVAGVTPAIDAHHAVLSELGDRFVFYRLPPTDAARQGEAALDLDDDGQMRAELVAAVAEFFTAVKPPDRPRKLQGAERSLRRRDAPRRLDRHQRRRLDRRPPLPDRRRRPRRRRRRRLHWIRHAGRARHVARRRRLKLAHVGAGRRRRRGRRQVVVEQLRGAEQRERRGERAGDHEHGAVRAAHATSSQVGSRDVGYRKGRQPRAADAPNGLAGALRRLL